MDVRIEDIEGGRVPKVAVHAPYHPDFPDRARELGGQKVQGKPWVFDARDRERVSALLRELFGTDGSEGDDGALVTVRVPLINIESRNSNVARFAGREVARREARDARVKLAPGVVLVAGKLAASGGSMRYPEIAADDDVVVEIRDLPRAALSGEDPADYTVVDHQVDVEALRAERARLVARLAEIDATLEFGAGEGAGVAR